jgi:hypothetical protein
LQRLQFFARLKADGFPGWDSHHRASARIAADSGFPGADVENAKASKFDSITIGERLFHGLKHSLNRHFGFGLGNAGSIDYFINNVEFDQESPWKPGEPPNLDDNKQLNGMSMKLFLAPPCVPLPAKFPIRREVFSNLFTLFFQF